MQYWAAVVDDDELNLKTAHRILSFQGYKVSTLGSGEELLEFVKDNTPDVILLDLHMQGIDGFETLRRLQANRKSRDIPVIFLTADDDADTETKALAAGAMDFVSKPFIPSVLIMRAKNTIELMRLQTDLKKEVRSMTREILKEHEKNERLSLQIVKTYSEKAQEEIYMMGLLHDVGKIGIPDTVINKPSRLTDEEYEMIKTHPTVGFEILKNISEMPKLAIGARWHHERYDGGGYPDGLSGKDIPEEARIISVADAYDAMSSRRSYHEVFAQKYIIGEFERGRGTQFDPGFADIMLAMIAEDSEYRMREIVETGSTGKTDLKKGETDDKVFSFLTILEIGGRNTAIGMKYCMNDVAFYIETLNEFVQSSNDRIEKLEKSLAGNDMDKYRIAAHSLKSASMTIGAEKLSESAKALEKAAKTKNTDFVSANHSDLIGSIRTTVSGILMATSMHN